LGIPTNSHKAFVVVLDSAGQVIARVEGNPTEARVEQVQSAIRSTKP
jgi:predicted transcriptional regulator